MIETLNVAAPVRPPRRLAEVTRTLARRGLDGEFGRQMAPATLKLEDVPSPPEASAEMQYAHAVQLIAETAPLRVLPDERIVGSATYLEGAHHQTPIHGGKSTSHLTLGFDRALGIGYQGLREQIQRRLARGDLDAKGVDLLNSMLLCLDAAQTWQGRYLSRLQALANDAHGEQRAHYESVLENARQVPEHPPRTFYQAVQSLWFMYAFQRLCGNWSGIGRIDQMLGPYLDRDLREGRITLDQAREVLAHFWIKGTEWIGARKERGSGDAQHYQNIVLAGVDADGVQVLNEVTYLVLDIVEELHISDFPVAVRVNAHTPEVLWRRIAEVQRLGGGIVSIYSEDVVLQALDDLGIPLREARTFANDGCWEVIIPGKTAFTYIPFDLLQVLQRALGVDDPVVPAPHHPIPEALDREALDFEALGFEDLYTRFLDHLDAKLHEIHADIDARFSDNRPATLISLLVEDCIERGRGYHDRGSRYVFVAPHAGGIADVCNSLFAIQRVVFEEKRLSLDQLIEILRADWQGHEPLRKSIRNRIEFYGNDCGPADEMMRRLFDDYTRLVRQVRERNGVIRPAGISTFGREITWRPGRKATAHGFREGDLLATNFSPTPGTDKSGPTAAIQSYCKMDFRRLPNGGTLEIKLHASSVKGQEGLASLVALLKSFVQLGGFYLNIDVGDREMLIDAQNHPERYPNLVVRIAGWCARFATLNKEWQDMVIQRTQQFM